MVSPSPVVSENDLCRLAADFELEFPKFTRQDFSTEPNYRRSYVVVIGRPLSNAANVVSSSFFFFPSPILSGRRLDVSHTSIHDVVLVGIYNCRSEMCCKRLAENTGRKNPASAHHCTNFAITSQLRHLSTIGKKLLNSNMSYRCIHNMANFGLLSTEICWRVWGNPAELTGFASCLHYCSDVAHRRPTKLCMMFGGSWAGILYMHFRELLPLTEFCQVQNSLCV